MSMSRVVIVGSGPIGLFTAIRLKQLGVQHVTVLDPRAGTYTRPGILDEKVFRKVEEELKCKISYSASRHIKDLERSLYKIARQHHVEILQEKFETFSKGGLAVSRTSDNKSLSSTHTIPFHAILFLIAVDLPKF
jgi:thioredoxin reductase